MSLRSLPLRLKLVIALLLPMLLVAVLIGDRVLSSIDDRQIAGAQQAEAARLEAVADFADAVGAESITTNDREATVEQLAAARAASDVAFEKLSDPLLGLDPVVTERASEHHADLVEIREAVGDRPSDISLRFQLETYTDPILSVGVTVTVAGQVPELIGRLAQLPGAIASDFVFAETAVVDVETSRLLADYEFVQRLRDDHIQEVSVLLQLVATPPSLVDDTAIDAFLSRAAATDASRALIEEFADRDVALAIAATRDSPAAAEYARLSAAASDTSPGRQRISDVTAVNSAASAITAQYSESSDEVVQSIRAQAERTADGAATSLVLVLIAGMWMLIVSALVLRLLYRAIRAPLQRLTEQSQHIATVELPYVVAAMRGGELDEAPAISGLVADADDEVGELVHAFNDMHRTAVELAAEQAGSRRMVADMFVNLGRRNQRLVNRLLKRLTVLESDEQDPDTLARLYEIDHVVTRMRRNANSLLVLAGESPMRRSGGPLEVYDIVQASLAEIEGYSRVDVVCGDDFQIHGDVVSDLKHLLAEIVENAVSFSPPSTQVEVSSHSVGDEYRISVIDLGVGMGDERIADANELIERAGDEDETPSEFLGHFVIGRLAARHGIDIRLSPREGGRGIVADIIVPSSVVVQAVGSSFDYPTAEQIDPRQREETPWPTKPPAIEDAVSLGPLRTPGRDLPAITRPRAAPARAEPSVASSDGDAHLSGFQTVAARSDDQG